MPSRCKTFDLSGHVEALHGRYSGRAFAPHWHEEFAIGVIDSGVEQFEYRGVKHHAVVNQIVLMDAGEVHTGEAADDRGFGFRMLYVSEAALRDIAGPASAANALHFPDAVVSRPAVANSLIAAHVALDQGYSRLETETRMTTALAEVLQCSGSWRPRIHRHHLPSAIKLARDYVNDHLAEDVSLAELSQLAGLSRFHFARVFKDYVGLAPHAYQMQQRVLKAKRLLRSASPIEVAHECGFCDQSHLNRAFRVFAGTTPGEYGRQFRELKA